MSAGRDEWMTQDDAALAGQCRLDFHKTTGNGGQKRNKTSSAVRVIHLPSGMAAVGDEGRSQKLNRRAALHRLRMEMALRLREPYREDEVLAAAVPPAPESPRYPFFAALVLDALAAAGWDTAEGAKLLKWSRSRLYAVLRRDGKLAAEVNRRRAEDGKSYLHF